MDMHNALQNSIQNWAEDRARFSHDWLMNSFYQAIVGLINVCEGKVQVDDIRSNVILLIQDWRKNMSIALRLINTCEESMSPRVLLDKLPLSLLDDEDKAGLNIIAHRIWLERYEIKQKLMDADACIRKVNSAIDYLEKNLLESKWERSSLTEFEKILSTIKDGCIELIAAMSNLPKHIMV
ncbi:MAG: hypothetical protein EHM85_02940 [Desulfobacteraceae bacterium]|nr:MAG: hypothetical protein EHM85_02940 [Desulfobacteraceae bacterium]